VLVTSVVGQGTTCTVYLPCSVDLGQDHASPEGALLTDVPTGAERVLLVDDEVALVHLGEAILQRLGYEVVVCTSSTEALEVFREAPQRFDLVITDQTMPHMTGERLAQALRRLRSDIPIILCTGFSHVMHAERAQELGIDAFLMKPLAMQELAQTIQQVMAVRHRPLS
jgi:CheY-like chemotaxis protein